MRRPIRPAAPLTAMRILFSIEFAFIGLAVQLNGLDDLVQIVGNGDGPIGERCPFHAASAEDFVEFLLVGRVVGNRGVRVLQQVARQNTHDAIIVADDPTR